MPIDDRDPHAHQPLLYTGSPLDQAKAVLILIHGRGATAQSMLSLYDELQQERLAAVAPQATANTWYPNSFLAPIQSNQPYLDSALARIQSIIADLATRGLKPEQIALLGFSQGACLTSEFIATHPRRYGAVMALSGGLIGPPGTPRTYHGNLSGTPVFLGSSDPDAHVPFERILETESTLKQMGATVEVRRYPGMAHTINQEELVICRAMLEHVSH